MQMYLRGFSSILLLTVWFYCCYLGFFVLAALKWLIAIFTSTFR